VQCGEHDIVREPYELYTEPDIAATIKIGRLGLEGNVIRMTVKCQNNNEIQPRKKKKSRKARS
jgi:hypothetical protein